MTTSQSPAVISSCLAYTNATYYIYICKCVAMQMFGDVRTYVHRPVPHVAVRRLMYGNARCRTAQYGEVCA